MTQMIKRYWKWDEKLNDTPYKLGGDISHLLKKGLVYPDKEEKGQFPGLGEGAPWCVDIGAGEVMSISFTCSKNSIFPKIKEGLWEMEEPKFTETLNSVLGPPCEPTQGDYLFVAFRGGFVTLAVIFRKFPR
jgi:hypothetical protein